ncbi:hypothetical protein DERP_004882 [Dermatophagoides pteronyssinus]|uniref:Uncharacterized protein n=1 Tax=Dermatophagoides pteronyssinus TaxID=6956 RepID=A0ABQ8JTN2_DERPT|nr:hypothetical protein DERP_004882 [Dermatophagoides pteronyssinus]
MQSVDPSNMVKVDPESRFSPNKRIRVPPDLGPRSGSRRHNCARIKRYISVERASYTSRNLTMMCP